MQLDIKVWSKEERTELEKKIGKSLGYMITEAVDKNPRAFLRGKSDQTIKWCCKVPALTDVGFP